MKTNFHVKPFFFWCHSLLNKKAHFILRYNIFCISFGTMSFLFWLPLYKCLSTRSALGPLVMTVSTLWALRGLVAANTAFSCHGLNCSPCKSSCCEEISLWFNPHTWEQRVSHFKLQMQWKQHLSQGITFNPLFRYHMKQTKKDNSVNLYTSIAYFSTTLEAMLAAMQVMLQMLPLAGSTVANTAFTHTST